MQLETLLKVRKSVRALLKTKASLRSSLSGLILHKVWPFEVSKKYSIANGQIQDTYFEIKIFLKELPWWVCSTYMK